HPKRRRLPSPVRPQQPDNLPAPHAEAHARHRPHPPERFGNLAYLNHDPAIDQMSPPPNTPAPATRHRPNLPPTAEIPPPPPPPEAPLVLPPPAPLPRPERSPGEEAIAGLLDVMGQGACVCDSQGVILWSNTRFRGLDEQTRIKVAAACQEACKDFAQRGPDP